MKTKICYVVKCHDSDEEEERYEEGRESDANGDEQKHKKHTDVNININVKNTDYLQYIAKHGHHFSKELAEYAVSKLDDANGRLKYDKVEEILTQSDEALTEGNTIADLYYLTNKIKSRHSTATIKSDVHVVMLAIECLNDPFDEEVFCDWCDNMKRRNEKIHWDKFL